MKHIGILCHSTFGGSARIATQLAIQLARAHEIHLFSRTVPFGRWDDNTVILHTLEDVPSDSLSHAKLHIDWTDSQFDHMVNTLEAVIIQEKLDILHFHYGIPFSFMAAEVKQRLKDKAPFLIGTLHGTEVSVYHQYSWRGQTLEQALKQVDHLTTVSQNHAELSRQRFQLETSPTVIQNFLTDFPILSQKRENYRPRIAHISNFRPVKRPLMMARIFADIRAHIDAELWLIGDGPEMPAVKEFFAEKGITQDVHFWGLQNHVEELLIQTDLLLMTSRAESFCLAGLEAMACGVPVVATRVGGIPEIVQHGKTGMMFRDNDRSQATRQILGLLTDRAAYAQMRQAAYERAQLFDVRHILPDYIALYERCV
jgi:L-malate glycosyltransferase